MGDPALAAARCGKIPAARCSPNRGAGSGRRSVLNSPAVARLPGGNAAAGLDEPCQARIDVNAAIRADIEARVRAGDLIVR